MTFGISGLISEVLILIVVEYALILLTLRAEKTIINVLILIVVEYALIPFLQISRSTCSNCLNPYCSGICSYTFTKKVRPVRVDFTHESVNYY